MSEKSDDKFTLELNLISYRGKEDKFDLGENLVDADHNLFGALRYFDDKDNIETIYVQGFNEGEESLAYMNRLNKAAGGHHLNK